MLGSVVLWMVLAAAPLGQVPAQPGVTPLPRAHAHNDYRHERPLLDALDQGFCSVEADIYLVDGQLLVGHDRHELTPGRTLQRLYLDPLQQRVRQHGGRVYPGGPTVTLLIDVKSEAEPTYAVLRKLLINYREMLSRQQGEQYVCSAVQVVISGNRALDTIARDSERLTGIDGRLTDLDSDQPASVLPLISDRWSSHFRWLGEGPMPKAEQQKLDHIVQQAHAAGRRVRFWATPESPGVWQALYTAGVDHINTDQLGQLRGFLLQQQSKTSSSNQTEDQR